MEARFGHDFSKVRIHTDADADEAAASVGARAFTMGWNVVLGRGQYEPATPRGRHLIAHELAHVVQQSAGTHTPPHAQLIQRLPYPPRPQDQFDPFQPVLKEAERESRQNPPTPAARVPEVTVPGDTAQQYKIFRVAGSKLLERPDVVGKLDTLADQVEAHTKGKSAGTLRGEWQENFNDSIEYILTTRQTRIDVGAATKKKPSVSAQELFRRRLAREEAALAKSLQGSELTNQVDALRARYAQDWADVVETAVQRYLILAENKAADILGENKPKLPFVFGLPAGLEKTLSSKDAPGQLEPEDPPAPVAASVVRFWKAVQEESGSKTKAENYKDHETHSPHFPEVSVGHYSFDAHPGISIDPATGFYEHKGIVAFFLAVEKASQRKDMGIEWDAYYNDASVIKEVNDKIQKGRLVFSGGGGHGTYHHGPEPYILHVHFNIMPTDLAAAFLVGKKLVRAQQIFEQFFDEIAARF